MADKYEQTSRDRERESKGMKKYETKHIKKYEKNHMEKGRMDSGYMGMISSDPSAPANLPQEKKMEYYPKSEYLVEDIDDSIRKVDEDIDSSVRKLKEHASGTMY